MFTSPDHRHLIFILLLLLLASPVLAQTPPSFRPAIVVDERLAVLRTAPDFRASLVRRLSRGRKVWVIGSSRNRAGITFQRVAVTRRTRGWVQSEALVWPSRQGEDNGLLRLIKASHDFERIARARIFLEAFPRSSLRPAVLLIFGEEATKAAQKLTQDANRKLDPVELTAMGASVSSYYLNYSGLDRYRRQGIVFTFDEQTRRFRYDGAAWRELLKRYANSAEAAVVRSRLGQ